jgi:hypothetical protein
VEDVEGGEDEDWSPDLATSPIPDQTSWDRGPARRQVESHLFFGAYLYQFVYPDSLNPVSGSGSRRFADNRIRTQFLVTRASSH